MCGDYGMAGELFRCRICSFRFQHKYCSHLYPRVQSYRACNWCLAAEGGRINSLTLEAEPTIAGNKSYPFNLATIARRSSGSAGGVKLGLRPFLPPINRPAKKLKAERVFAGGVRNGRPVFRARVRRYKLLEELCC
ncbi:hypothetical protein KSP39_PZI020688 [Platanthera zijinensis]|uniref:PHD-type zinc finger plants domain-containing protein n=1 Tax=Platanthera zijinensis TaxID=2320716 RepID=A0AAP0B0B8_9ASPA